MNFSAMNIPAPEDSRNATTGVISDPDILEICTYSFSFLFGLPTHCFVVWLIITRSRSGLASEFFLLNLSVCEVVNSLNGLVFVVSVWVERLRLFEIFLLGFLITGRPAFQSLMCVERYMAVVHPVTFLKYKPLRYRLVCSIAAWTITLSSCLCSMLTYFTNVIVHVWSVAVQHKIVLCIQLFCLVAVLKALKQPAPGETRKDEDNQMKRTAFFLILITTITSIILYVPFTVAALVTILSGYSYKLLWVISLILYVLASFVQPFLYLQRSVNLSLCSLFRKTGICSRKNKNVPM